MTSILPTSLPLQGRLGQQNRRNSFRTTTSRCIGVLIFLACFGGIGEWDIWESMVQNIDASTTVSRNRTSTSTLPIVSNAASRKRTNHTRTFEPNDDDSWIDPFEEQPGCLLLRQMAEEGQLPRANLSMRGILETYGAYVPTASLDRSSSEPRYDHRSCFLMRPRYNCARNFQNATTNDTFVASDFALILNGTTRQLTSNDSGSRNNNYDVTSTSVCDLQKFVHDAGGPAGVGRRMLQNYQKPTKTDPLIARATESAETKNSIDSNRETSPVEVLLVGTSRFRQIFEALVCGFSDQVTNLKLQLGGPAFNVNHKYMNAEKIGPLVGLDFVKNGSCYEPEAQASYSEFFRDDGTIVPKNHDRCNDNIAMVEFDFANTVNHNSSSNDGGEAAAGGSSKIRFYYVFRPWAWTNVTPALEALGIENRHKLDFVLWEPKDVNDEASWQYDSSMDLESLYQSMFDIRNITTTTSDSITAKATTLNIEQHDAHELYKRIQLRDIGRYFGADNPWIINPPDEEHPCMPGMPDDKVNFLLWYMLSLSALE